MMLRQLTPQEQQQKQVQKSLRNLLSLSKEKQQQAAEALQQNSAAAIEPLLTCLEKESRRYAARLRRVLLATGVGGILLTGFNIIALALAASAGHPVVPALLMWDAWTLYLVSTSFALASLLLSSKARKRLQSTLCSMEDIRVAGPLAEMLEHQDYMLRATAAQALLPLLPRITAAHAGLFTPEQKHGLCSILNSTRKADIPLMLAALQALGQIGDASALRQVERLLENRSRRFRDVHDAAERLLPALRERAAQEEMRTTLLRANAEPSNTLLHPAQNVNENSLLLHPSLGEQENE